MGLHAAIDYLRGIGLEAVDAHEHTITAYALERLAEVPGLRVVLPATLPRLLSGARIALGVGFMVIVGAEMIGTIRGLGSLLMDTH